MVRKVRIHDQANVGSNSNDLLKQVEKENYGDTFFRKNLNKGLDLLLEPPYFKTALIIKIWTVLILFLGEGTPERNKIGTFAWMFTPTPWWPYLATIN